MNLPYVPAFGIFNVPFGQFPVAAYDWAKAKMATKEPQVIDEPEVQEVVSETPAPNEEPREEVLVLHLSSSHSTVLERQVQEAVDTSRDVAVAEALTKACLPTIQEAVVDTSRDEAIAKELAAQEAKQEQRNASVASEQKSVSKASDKKSHKQSHKAWKKAQRHPHKHHKSSITK